MKEQQCAQGHYANRVISIDAYGTFIYDYVCEKEKTVTLDVEPAPPQTVNARYAEGLRPGMAVEPRRARRPPCRSRAFR